MPKRRVTQPLFDTNEGYRGLEEGVVRTTSTVVPAWYAENKDEVDKAIQAAQAQTQASMPAVAEQTAHGPGQFELELANIDQWHAPPDHWHLTDSDMFHQLVPDIDPSPFGGFLLEAAD